MKELHPIQKRFLSLAVLVGQLHHYKLAFDSPIGRPSRLTVPCPEKAVTPTIHSALLRGQHLQKCHRNALLFLSFLKAVAFPNLQLDLDV